MLLLLQPIYLQVRFFTILNNPEDPVLNISNINFGCPRVGNPAFAEYYATFNIYQTWRFTHYNDIVPHLPALALGIQI